MSATLDYDLKRSMKILTKGDRWNVLTVLMLHTNIRNRSYPSMETIAEMATGGSRNKASAAKTWLLKHGAIKLVEYDKRVDDEAKLPNRQHVYQLTGHWYACFEKECDCGSNGAQYLYLYQGTKRGAANEIHRTTIDTMKTGHRTTIHNINGDTLSISSKSNYKKKEKEKEQSASNVAQLETSLSLSGQEPQAPEQTALHAERDVTTTPMHVIRSTANDLPPRPQFNDTVAYIEQQATARPLLDAYKRVMAENTPDDLYRNKGYRSKACHLVGKGVDTARIERETLALKGTDKNSFFAVYDKILKDDAKVGAAVPAAPPTASYHRYTRINPDTGETETSDTPFTAYSDDLPEAS